jgi:hypothetical protein
MVADRRAGGIGQIEGEKTLTPLTFSCSPLLLHPLQGKKIKLMHIMKKSVTTKLVAEKVEPPALRSPITLHPTPAPLGNSPINIMKSRWNLHRRAQSHVAPTADAESEAENLMVGYQETPPIVRSAGTSAGRRRRASSAGERTRRSFYREDFPPAPPLLHPSHIVPPSKLTELMTIMADQADHNTGSKAKALALSPSPRSKWT